MIVDSNTMRNLELFRNSKGGRSHTLFSIIDYTKTAIGSRLLEKMLMEPSINRKEIIRRQNVVDGFYGDLENVDLLKKYLDQIGDIPRILTRLNHYIRNPRELGSLRLTLAQLPKIVSMLEKFSTPEIEVLAEKIDLFPELLTLLNHSLKENLPNDVVNGGYICDGFDEQVDYLRKLINHSNEWLCELERDEQHRTGIKNLRIK
jgi:DNA mismatch repair protein MutS